jgi:hypothetical protein
MTALHAGGSKTIASSLHEAAGLLLEHGCLHPLLLVTPPVGTSGGPILWSATAATTPR